MPRVCTICTHEKRSVIDESLVGGESYRNVSKRFSASLPALFRHRVHIPAVLARAHDAQQIAAADGLAAKLLAIEAEARRLGQKAEKAGDLRTALMAVRELVRLTELAARVSGELEPAGVTVNIVASSAWMALRGRILAALAPFPDARISVAEALRSTEDA